MIGEATLKKGKRVVTVEAQPEEPKKTLRDIRTEKRFSYSEVSKRLKAVGVDVTRSAVEKAETRGTDRLSLIEAFSKVYEMPFDTVKKAAEASRERAKEANAAQISLS